MKENSFTFSALGASRYSDSWSHNVVTQVNCHVVASPTWELQMNIRYNDIVSLLKRHFGIDDDATGTPARLQQYRNTSSTLTGFLTSIGKTLDSRVGTELNSAFITSCDHYLSLIDVSQRTKEDRRTHLRLIRRLHQENPPASREKRASSLSDALRSHITALGIAPKTLAKQIGICPSAMQRWLAGAYPNTRGIPSLRRLETALGLERDSLVKLINDKECAEKAGVASPATRQTTSAVSDTKSDTSSRLAPVSTSFEQEWRALLDYKTTAFPMLERHPRGVWRVLSPEVARVMNNNALVGGMPCPSADFNFGMLRRFFGAALDRTPEQGGIIVTPTSERTPQTLAWLAVPGALKSYIDHLTYTSGGLHHNGHKTFCGVAANLLRAKTGYLWQQPQFAQKLPPEYRPVSDDAWRAQCELCYRMLRAIIATASDVVRLPTAPIAKLLQLEEPLRPIIDAIARIDREAAKAAPGGIRQAVLKRDALLLALTLSNPLRQRTLMALTWNDDSTGTLRGSPERGWRIELQPKHLKTGRASLSDGTYSVRVAPWLKRRLDDYIEEYRPTLLKGRKSAYLFVSSRSTGLWKSMGQRVQKLTARYVDHTNGFGTHAFRHLIATDWLVKHPNDFLTVSELLNDKLSTVMKHYAHLKRDVSFSRYEDRITSILD